MPRIAEVNKAISGMPITRSGVHLSHLLCANDRLLFCKANMREWCKMQEILEGYEKASGQRLNRDKTSIFFSKSNPLGTRECLIFAAGVPLTQSYETYLSLPALVGRS